MEDSLCEDGRKTSLRERIKRSMGTGIHVPWSSMPEVQSSGLLEKLAEDKLALEQLKFCLITCEVAFNVELADLVNLCKRSVSWSDPLPAFNRRTIASTVERIKRCSDGFLNLIEKQWNVKPVLSIATLCKILTDMAPQLQNFVTFCSYQEDLRSVFYNAMRNKPEIATASISSRMNIELILLPLQHLILFRYLLQDIRSELTSMENRLESFHCKRALTEVTKLLEDCYKVLASAHGSKYIENLESLLDESVHSRDQNYYKKFCYETSNHRKNSAAQRGIVRRSSSTSSSVATKLKKSFQSTKTSEIETKNRTQKFKEHCKFFNLYSVDVNNNNQKSLSNYKPFKLLDSSKSEKSKLKRQKPVDVKRDSFDFAVKLRSKSSSVFNDRLSKFEVQLENNNNLYKGNDVSVKSKFICYLPDKVRVSEPKVSNGKKFDHLNKHVYSTLENENSHKDVLRIDNEVKLSRERNNDCVTEISSQSSASILNIRKNDISSESPHFEGESKSTEDSDKHSVELPSLKPNPQIDLSVKLTENSTNIITSDMGQTSTISSEHTYLSDCNANANSGIADDSLTSETAPLKVKFTSVDTLSEKDGLMTRKINSEPNIADRLQTENSFSLSVTDFGSICHERPDENVILPHEELSYSNSPIKTTEKLYFATDSADSSNKSNETYVSCYDFGQADAHESYPLAEAYNEYLDYDSSEDFYYQPMHESYHLTEACNEFVNYNNGEDFSYQPMHDSFKRTHNSISPSRFKKKVNTESASEIRHNGIDLRKFPFALLSVSNSDCVHEYEDLDMFDSRSRSESILSHCEDVPLYQAYKYEDVKVRKSRLEEDLYIDPDEHVYEEIKDYLKTEILNDTSGSNMEISKPSGSSDRVRWVDIMEVVNSGLLDRLDNTEIALQEAKYEVITSEASYFKSLIILDAIFISNPDLKDILTKPEHATLFSSIMKVKQSSQSFLVVLLDDWQEDLMLNYLCKAMSKFVESGAFQVYVDCCANLMIINRTLECLKLNNPAFTETLSKLESDPICQSFTLQSFLTLPMQRVTRLPLLVEAILKRLSADIPEYQPWKTLLHQLQEVANECNEAIAKVDRKTVIEYEQLKLMNEKIMTLNAKQLSYQKKKQQSIWNVFKIKKPST